MNPIGNECAAKSKAAWCWLQGEVGMVRVDLRSKGKVRDESLPLDGIRSNFSVSSPFLCQIRTRQNRQQY